MILKPTFVSPPCETIQEEMKYSRLSWAQLVGKLGIKSSDFRAIMIGKKRITQEIAQKLSAVFQHISEDFWLTRDERYHLELEGKYRPQYEMRKLADERKIEAESWRDNS